MNDRLKDILANAKRDAAAAQSAADERAIAKQSDIAKAIVAVREAFVPRLESAREAWKGDGVSIEITDNKGRERDVSRHRWPVFTVTFKTAAHSRTYAFQTSTAAYFDISTAGPEKYLNLSVSQAEDVTDAVVEEFLNIAVRETLGLQRPGH
jgi:hypothetical protein